MEIRINGIPAMLKKGTSFEYVAENRLFSGSDGYTLSITFPLRQCPQNLEIFGHINRADVIAGKVIFDCEIRDRNFYKFGSIVITEYPMPRSRRSSWRGAPNRTSTSLSMTSTLTNSTSATLQAATTPRQKKPGTRISTI